MRPRAAPGSAPSRIHRSRLQEEAVSGPEAGGRSRGELDDDLRAFAPRRLPRLQVVLDADHDEVAVAEDGVDREAHEEHVNRAGRPEEHALPFVEPRAAEQPPHPFQRRVRELAALADDLAARLLQHAHGHNYPFLVICTEKLQESCGSRVSTSPRMNRTFYMRFDHFSLRREG